MPYSPADEAAEAEAARQEAEERAKKGGPSTFSAEAGGAQILKLGKETPAEGSGSSEDAIVPIVYFYIISNCETGLPGYLKDTVAQAVETQSGAVLISIVYGRASLTIWSTDFPLLCSSNFRFTSSATSTIARRKEKTRDLGFLPPLCLLTTRSYR